jgi:hypothetical protein
MLDALRFQPQSYFSCHILHRHVLTMTTMRARKHFFSVASHLPAKLRTEGCEALSSREEEKSGSLHNLVVGNA